MNIINDKKISLIAKLVISYALLLDIAFIFYVFNTDPGTDQTTRGAVLTNLLSWTATLFTPIAAYFFYDAWKEQKTYEIEKEYADNALHIIFNLNKHINKCYYSYIELRQLDNNIIYLNKRTLNSDFESTSQLYDLESKLKTLQKISENKLNKETIKNHEDATLIMIESINRIEKVYNEYYTQLDQLTEKNKPLILLNKNDNALPIRATMKEINLKNKYNNNYTIQIEHNYKGKFQNFENNFKGFKENYDKYCDKINNELIKIIKP